MFPVCFCINDLFNVSVIVCRMMGLMLRNIAVSYNINPS